LFSEAIADVATPLDEHLAAAVNIDGNWIDFNSYIYQTGLQIQMKPNQSI
jgi:hypothetical protein